MDTKLTGLQKQDAFLTKKNSLPLSCPSCGGYHSYIEARGSSDWTKDYPVKCPESAEKLVHNVPMLGENFFTIETHVAREMSNEEEQQWQALDDNMDWMNDDQINKTANQIRSKYNK